MRAYITHKIAKIFHIDAHYFISSGFWSFLGQAVGLIAGIATSALFAHILIEKDYGTYRYLLGIAAFLSSFSFTGIGQSIFQAAAKKYRQFYIESIHTSLIYNIGISITGILGTLYYFYNANITLAIGCLLIAIFQPIIIAYQNIFMFLQGSSLFREATVLQIIRTVIVSIISISTILVTENILILLGTYLGVNALINFLTHLYYCPSQQEDTPQNIRQKYIQYAKHSTLRNLIADIAFRLDTVIIFQQLGAIELAVYSIANIVPEQVKGSLKNLASLILPKYVQHADIESIKKSVPMRSIQLLIILCAITIIYIIVSPIIYHILFPKYENAILYSQLAALAFPTFISIIPMSALQSQIKNKELHNLNNQNAILTILFTLIFITTHGILGAIFAKVLSRYINTFSAYYYLYKK